MIVDNTELVLYNAKHLVIPKAHCRHTQLEEIIEATTICSNIALHAVTKNGKLQTKEAVVLGLMIQITD